MALFSVRMSYHADHLAWQQRVAQELSRASQFHKTSESFYRRSHSAKTDQSRNQQASRQSDLSGKSGVTAYSYLTTISTNPKLRQHFDENGYKNAKINMAYSFGGKTHASNAFKEAATQGNPVLSRPSTAGSLKTRRSFKVTDGSPIDKLQQGASLKKPSEPITPKTPDRPRSMSRNVRVSGARSISRGSHRHSESSGQGTMNRLNLSALNPATHESQFVDMASLHLEDQEPIENGDNPDEELTDQVDDLESVRPPSAVTWKTTSSQRRYISELERLLLEERKRREELEAKVNLILEKSSLKA